MTTEEKSCTHPLNIILIHGTYARNARWTTEEGRIFQALKKRFGERVAIEDLPWDAGNSNSDRQNAAAKLIDTIGKSQNDKHVLIGHSHAGNIVSYASLDDTVKQKVCGVVTLATPFIVARRGYVSINLSFARSLMMALSFLLLYLLNQQLPAALSLTYRLFIHSGLLIALFFLSDFLIKRWAGFSETFLQSLQHGLREDTLIIRAMGDEASSGISVTQVPAMMAGLLLGWASNVIDKTSQMLYAVTGGRPLLMASLGFLILIIFTVPFVHWLGVDDSILAIVVGFVGLCFFQLSIIVYKVLLKVPIGDDVLSIPMFLLVVPLLIPLTLLSMAFGPRFALASLYINTSIEATPPGTYQVHLLEEHIRIGGLQHSSVYNNDVAINLICDYVEKCLGACQLESVSTP